MIDDRAIIDSGAKLASYVSVGPFSIIGPEVEIGEGTSIGPHVVIKGPCKIGKHNTIFQFSSIGEIPQDLKFHGEHSVLEIGDHNTIREFTTLQRGTENGGGITKIGNHNLLMNYVHIAHDCIVGDHAIFSNNASLAGHVLIKDYVILGGFAGIAQFLTVGEYAFVCTNSVVNKDVLPYTLVSGHFAKPFGLNSVGLKRHEFSEAAMSDLNQAYKIIYRKNNTLDDAIKQLQDTFAHSAHVMKLVESLETSKNGITR